MKKKENWKDSVSTNQKVLTNMCNASISCGPNVNCCWSGKCA